MIEEQPPPNLEPGVEPEGPPPEPERYPFWGYSDLLLFAGLVIPSMLTGWALVKTGMFLFHIHAALRVAELLSEQFLGYAILFGGLLLILRMQYQRPFWRSLAWTDASLPFLWNVICGLGAAFVVALVGYLIHTPNISNPITEMMQDRASVILLATFGVTLGPLCEELAFRGFLQPLLVRSLGAVPGILAATIPFGLLHFQEYGNSWRHAVLIAVAGASFGWMRHATGSTKAATIMHASYNALFFFVLFAQRRELPHIW
jgi:membrane protease YdiL (CAAX protease family)